MRFESIGAVICNSSLKKLSQIQSLKKEVAHKYSTFKELKGIVGSEDTPEEVENILNQCRQDIKLLEKLERKANGYKKIIVEENGDYESSTTRITFSQGTSRKFIYEWLTTNDYPIKNQHYHVSSMYDCSGQLYKVYFKHKCNVVEITGYYDV